MDIFSIYYTLDTLKESINASIFNISFLILIGLIVIDILSGTIKSIKKREWDSSLSKFGVLDHLLIVTVVFFVDMITNIIGMDAVTAFAETFKLFFIASYAGSIIENFGEMGIQLPKSITKYFDRL